MENPENSKQDSLEKKPGSLTETNDTENDSQLDQENDIIEITSINDNKFLYHFKNFGKKVKLLNLKLNQNRKLKNILKTILCFLLLFTSIYFYAIHINALCDEKKFPVPDQCMDALIENLPTWFSSIFIASILILTVLLMSVKKNVPRYNAIFAIFTAYFLIQIIHGPIDLSEINLRNYETAHSIALLIFLLLESIIVLYVFIHKVLYQNIKIVFLVLVGVQIYGIISLYKATLNSCDGWENGLVGKIDFSDEYCEVKVPSVCWPNILDNVFNLGPDTCNIKDKQKMIKQTLMKYNIIDENNTEQEIKQISEDIKFIGWPLSTNLTPEERSGENGLASNIVNNSKLYNSAEESFQDGREIALDLQHQQLRIHIQRNETLVNERKKIQNDKNLSNNVIMIYLDTVSRPQTLRKLKKSMAFLRKYANFESDNYEKNDLKSKVFEYFRFHSIDRKTQDNVFKLRYNMQTRDWKKNYLELDQENKITSLLNDIKNAGYIFGHATNSLSIKSNLRGYTHKDQPLTTFFEDDPADHELYLFDPNYVYKENSFGVQKGANSVYRRCLYGKDTNYYPFQYGKKFLNTYKQEKKFLLLEFTDAHEFTSEVIQYLDDNLHDFLLNLEDQGFMQKDTIVYMLGDHGQHLVSNYQPLQVFLSKEQQEKEVYSIERMLPFFYMSVSNDILEKNMQFTSIFKKNSQKIFGMGEVRNTLLTNVYGLDYQYNYRQEMNQTNYNLFNDNMPSGRSCLDIGMNDLNNPFHYCSCKPQGDIENFYKIRSQKGSRYQNEINNDNNKQNNL